MSTVTRTDAHLSRFRTETAQTTRPQTRPVASHHDKADWLAWYLETNPQSLLTNDELRALAVTRGKRIAPGTIGQHDQYIRECDGQEFGAYIRQLRQKAIFGLWADGSKTGPEMPNVQGVENNKIRWMLGQSNPCKYLKWFKQRDPEGWIAFVKDNPKFDVVPPVHSVMAVSAIAESYAT